MRHQKAFRKFGRTPSHRKAMFRNLVTSLLKHEKIETTVSKAKDLRRIAEKYITLGREDTLHRRRQALAYITDKEVVHKLFADIGPRFTGRAGGYTRIIRTRTRTSDATELAIIELVGEGISKPAKKTESKAGAKAKTSSSTKAKSKTKSKAKGDSSAKAATKSTEKKAKAKKKSTAKKAKAKK